ncbi:MAG TPA: VOC family protein [Vicinamibacterales bacterium]|nr:VOC family protein [Vicinamibacterales bacterium]
MIRTLSFALAIVVIFVGGARTPARDIPLPVAAVESIGMTVSDLEAALSFYTRVLAFTLVDRRESSGRPFELLTGVFGARARSARLRLGEETIELTEFLAPRGRPIPDDLRANDRIFQHIAIVVSDIDTAYRQLRAAGVEHGSSGPQRLPDWNTAAGGIAAFYFRDPDRHFLEVIQFPRGKGSPRWQDRSRTFLGIDHTAIVVEDTAASLRFYRDALGLQVAGQSENYDVEQEHLNGVFGARLRITGLRAASGPGIELLEYLAPRDGRPAPTDLRANDLAHWQTTVSAGRLEALLPLARDHRIALVSPGPIELDAAAFGFSAGALARDPDGHALRIVSMAAPPSGDIRAPRNAPRRVESNVPEWRNAR